METNNDSERNKIGWRCRLMKRGDIEKCLIIWKRVELTEAYETVLSCLETDPLGFYVAELNDTGKFGHHNRRVKIMCGILN